MKAILNVDGKQLEVVSISYHQNKITDVQITDGIGVYQTYYDEKSITFHEGALSVNMQEALEFPDIGQRIVDERNKLIEHLEKLVAREDDELTGIAIDAMEGDLLPFSELALIDSQKEYKLMQQRVLGIIDVVEEVKAYSEGYYANVNDEDVE